MRRAVLHFAHFHCQVNAEMRVRCCCLLLGCRIALSVCLVDASARRAATHTGVVRLILERRQTSRNKTPARRWRAGLLTFSSSSCECIGECICVFVLWCVLWSGGSLACFIEQRARSQPVMRLIF